MANGVVYVGSNDGSVYAFDLAGGTAAAPRPVISKLRPDYSLRPQRDARPLRPATPNHLMTAAN